MVVFLCKYYGYCTFPYLHLELACKQLCFTQRTGINRRNESTINIIEIAAFVIVKGILHLMF